LVFKLMRSNVPLLWSRLYVRETVLARYQVNLMLHRLAQVHTPVQVSGDFLFSWYRELHIR